jgi:hypothetical protein
MLFICVDRWTTQEGYSYPLLSHDIETEEEVDEVIEGLHRELDIARRLTKAALRQRRQPQKVA